MPKPKRILVTGVSPGGIGQAICQQFKDARFVVSTTESMLNPLSLLDADVRVIAGDLRNPGFPEDLVKRAVKFLGGLDLVVSNAGKSQQGDLNDLSLEDWNNSLDLHVRAAWLLAKASYSHLKESGGSFIAIGSASGTEPHGGHGAYPVAKAALIALCKNLAVEWMPIRVNIVSPGLVSTARSPKSWAEGVVPLGLPADVASAVAFLAENPYMTGHNLVVDGGLTIAGMGELIRSA
jgi:glucose 1-dehydrogenase